MTSLCRGGANRIAQVMKGRLPAGSIHQNHWVTKIAPVEDGKETVLSVSILGEEPREYAHVISTVPLGAVRMIDLDERNLSYALTEALRTLQYGPSTKVGVRFKSRWWEECGRVGGVSSTDMCAGLKVAFSGLGYLDRPRFQGVKSDGLSILWYRRPGERQCSSGTERIHVPETCMLSRVCSYA